MSQGKKQDSTERKRERADFVARVLQQRCSELRDLSYQNFEAENDPPDLVFGEKNPSTGMFPIGVELMEFYLGTSSNGGSLFRRIEQQKQKITLAAWESFRAEYPDDYFVCLDWHEGSKFDPEIGLPMPQALESDLIARLVRFVGSQIDGEVSEVKDVEWDLLHTAGLSNYLKSIAIGKVVIEAESFSLWSSFDGRFTGVYPGDIESYIQKKEVKPFKHECAEKWLVLITDVDGEPSTYMEFIELPAIQSKYFDCVLRLKLRSQRLDVIYPELRVANGCGKNGILRRDNKGL